MEDVVAVGALVWRGRVAVGAGGRGLPPGFDPARHMRVSEIKPGMKGYGLSVFRGTKIERFDVEVVSIVRNFTPKMHMVLVTLKGQNLEHTGAIAGMSGSPVFLVDEAGRERLAGAFAYGWPMAKDPIGGLQPIEYMLALPTKVIKPDQPTVSKTTESVPAAHPKIHWPMDKYLPHPGEREDPALAPADASANLLSANAPIRLRPLAMPVMMS